MAADPTAGGTDIGSARHPADHSQAGQKGLSALLPNDGQRILAKRTQLDQRRACLFPSASSSSSRWASWFSSHSRASAAALCHVGFWFRRLGNGAFRFMVARDLKSRKRSAIAGNRPAASAASRLPYLCSSDAAPAVPTPGAPGTLSEGSPRKAIKSGTFAGSTPYRARTSAGPIRAISPARRG